MNVRRAGSLPAVAQIVFFCGLGSHGWVEGHPLQLGRGACFDSVLSPVTGRCARCGENVVGEGTGCTAMDQVFHVECFTCIMCSSKLRGQPFYAVEKKAYCEPCYIVSTPSSLCPDFNAQTWETSLLSLLWSCLTAKIWQPCGRTVSNRFFVVFRRALVFSAYWVNYISWSELPLKWSGRGRRKSWVLWLFHLCMEHTVQSFFSSSVVLSFLCWETWYQNGYRLWCPLRLRRWDAREH